MATYTIRRRGGEAIFERSMKRKYNSKEDTTNNRKSLT